MSTGADVIFFPLKIFKLSKAISSRKSWILLENQNSGEYIFQKRNSVTCIHRFARRCSGF